LINYDCFSIITKSGVLRKGAEHQFCKKYAEEVAGGRSFCIWKNRLKCLGLFFQPFLRQIIKKIMTKFIKDGIMIKERNSKNELKKQKNEVINYEKRKGICRQQTATDF